MAEILGVIAAATQLSSTCLNLLDITRKIKGGSSTLKSYQQQLQELRSLSEAISSNPLFQTSEVEAYTHSLLTVIKENDVEPLIQRSRFFRSWIFISKDRELSQVFESLERKKSSLSLLIHNLQAQAIHDIQINVTDMSQRPGEDACPADNEAGESLTGQKDLAPTFAANRGLRRHQGKSEPKPLDYGGPPGQMVASNKNNNYATAQTEQSLTLRGSGCLEANSNPSYSTADRPVSDKSTPPSIPRISPAKFDEFLDRIDKFAERNQGHHIHYTEGNHCDRDSKMSNQLKVSTKGEQVACSEGDDTPWSSIHVGNLASRGSSMNNSRDIEYEDQTDRASFKKWRFYSLDNKAYDRSSMNDDVNFNCSKTSIVENGSGDRKSPEAP